MHGPETNCDKCSHITRSRSDMQKHHLMRHSDNPTHVCNVCNYFAFNQEDLDSHSSTHNSAGRRTRVFSARRIHQPHSTTTTSVTNNVFRPWPSSKK